MDREFKITEIVTLGMPDKKGNFYLEVRAENLEEGEDEVLFLEMDFAMFYNWFDEETLYRMKRAYVINYLKIEI
jgi:hypothetical protein